jgi:DNA-binding HxlR family transcriptional regulator
MACKTQVKYPVPMTDPCPVTYALQVFGDRWSLLVLRDVLMEGRSRYGEMLAAHEGLATNVLAARLRMLEGHGLIVKRRDPGDARQFLYRPTPRAVALIPMLLEMIVWGAAQGQAGAREQDLARRHGEDRAALIAECEARARGFMGSGD